MNYFTVVLHADGSAYTGSSLRSWVLNYIEIHSLHVRFPVKNDVHVGNKLEICFLLAPVTFILYLGNVLRNATGCLLRPCTQTDL